MSSCSDNESNESNVSNYDTDEEIKPIRKKKITNEEYNKICDELIIKTNETLDDLKSELNINNNSNKHKTELLNLPLIEKFRPQKLNDVMSHDNIVECLKRFIKTKQLPHLIFSGPAGTGKTSTILACAKELYKENFSMMVLIINASEERGVEVVRTKITEFSKTKGMFFNDCPYKLIILDEADAMTSEAQSMLVNIIEKTSQNARFCLICNYIKKIKPAILSRCTLFKFPPLKREFIIEKILSIQKTLNINITTEGIDKLIKISNGDMRKILNILQATNMLSNVIDEECITSCLGYPSNVDIKLIYKYLTNKKMKMCDIYTNIYDIIIRNNYSLNDVIIELTDILINDKNISLISMKYIIKQLSIIELHMITNKIQILALISLFIKGLYLNE